MPAKECTAIRDGLLGSDTVGFLSQNVIRTSTDSQDEYPTSATRFFDFTYEGKTAEGGAVYDHVSPENQNVINGLLEVFYLPWRINAGYYIILGPKDGPDIMMTATMSGCSVGYIRGSGGAIRVSHHNIRGRDSQQAQERTLSFVENALHPDVYHHDISENRGEVNFASRGFGFVFGVRRQTEWTMYWQKIAVWREQNNWTANVVASAINVKGAGIL
ncbi:MAG TPA: hypothetical protein VMU81_20235 [Acetobacteraceae bacterium]|nr:hypothetical protein [Acetobacteraceae bacterium]